MNSLEYLYHNISIFIPIIHLRSSTKIAPIEAKLKLVPSKPQHIDSLVILRSNVTSDAKQINTLTILNNLFSFYPKNILLSEIDRKNLQQIMKKYPKIFQTLDDALMTIIRKGHMQLHDIPQVVFIVFSIFQNNKYITVDNSLNIIKFIVESILDSCKYPFSILENELITKQIVLNNSFALLEAKLPVAVNKKTVFNTFLHFFILNAKK